jgi:outer membrane protein W
MHRLYKSIFGVGLCTLMLVGGAAAQNVGGRWAIGALGGGNVWISDLNQMKFGLGGSVSVRYGFTPVFSIGFLGGLEVLKSAQDVALSGLPYTYLRVNAYPVALSAYFRLAPNSLVSPYVRIGGGMMFYTRATAGGAPAPDDQVHTTYMIPIGIGIEAFTARNFAIDVELGATNFSDNLDLRANSSPDGALSAWYKSEESGHRW